MVGQEAVVTTLRNQVKYAQLGHAYLFCGTRGTGKTSAAKVFAKAVNCLHPVNGNPCNECDLCREAENGFNVIEIDAASNNGVDNIRDLRDEVQYTPSKGKYKVYIIDEVHMLSTSAFNALLKTLEEPPEHVIFVLATTDPQKVLPTIISRCQRYDFKRITTEKLCAHLKDVCEKEGIQAEEDALSYIAMMADGGCRDALSILDQCHAYYIHETITLEKAHEVLGAVDEGVFREMTEALVQDDIAALLRGIEKVFDDGRDALQFVISWSSYLRDLVVASVLKDRAGETLHKDDMIVRSMQELAERAGIASLSAWIEHLASLEAQMRGVLQRRVLMEVSVIQMVYQTGKSSANISVSRSNADAAPLSAAAAGSLQKMERRLERLEKTVREGHVADNAVSRAEMNVSTAAAEKEAPIVRNPQPIVTSEDVKEVIARWNSIIKIVTDQEPGLMTLQKVRPEQGEEPGTIRLTSESEIFLKMLSTPSGNKLRIIENAITDETGKRFKLIIGKAVSSKKSLSPDTLSRINMDVSFD